MRKPITSIGELGVSVGDRDWLFRPSFSAIASLGSPAEIVEKFSILFEPARINPVWPAQSYRSWERDVASTAYDVLVACCDDDATPLLGHMGTRWGSFVLGAMPIQDMVHLARSLMRHGVIGLKPEGLLAKPIEEEFTAEFNARDFVSQAVAHLGMSTAEAWNLTMTEFSGAMQSKFGKPEMLPSLDDHDEAMSRLAEINKLRQNQVKK